MNTRGEPTQRTSRRSGTEYRGGVQTSVSRGNRRDVIGRNALFRRRRRLRHDHEWKKDREGAIMRAFYRSAWLRAYHSFNRSSRIQTAAAGRRKPGSGCRPHARSSSASQTGAFCASQAARNRHNNRLSQHPFHKRQTSWRWTLLFSRTGCVVVVWDFIPLSSVRNRELPLHP